MFEKTLNARLADAVKAKIEPVRKAGEAAKRAATINVRGAPENPAVPLSVKEAQDEVLRRHGMLN